MVARFAAKGYRDPDLKDGNVDISGARVCAHPIFRLYLSGHLKSGSLGVWIPRKASCAEMDLLVMYFSARRLAGIP